MKKIVFIFILMLGVLNAKQIATCHESDVTKNSLSYCVKSTANGKMKHLTEESLGEMYASGWRLITTLTKYYDGRLIVIYYYFEK